MSNGVVVGKRLGVAPTLARRTPAAGRNGKRLVTGDKANVHAIVGKAGIGGVSQPRRETVEALLRARRANKAKGGVSNVRYGGRLQGDVNKAAAGTNGMGQLVPQFRGASLKSLTPQAPSFAPKQQKTGNTLVASGGTKPSTAGLSGVGTASSSGGAASGGGVGAAGGVGKRKGWQDKARERNRRTAAADPTYAAREESEAARFRKPGEPKMKWSAEHGGLAPVGKRSYDPEDERRHRQGALAASGGIGGGLLAHSGGREILRDTKLQRGAPAVLHPGSPPQRGNGYWSDMKTKRVRAIRPEELRGEDMAYDVNRARYANKLEAHGRLAKPKGVQVTGRSGGKVGAGLALIGGGVALHRKRREPRYD